MNIAIIGGGISGLYTAYKLYKKYDKNNIKITIFEKNDYLGGRIHTINKKNNHVNKTEFPTLTYDTGAGRFSNQHKYLLNLIKDLDIQDQIIELHSTPNIYIKNNVKTPFELDFFIDELLEYTKIIPTKILKSKTLLLLMKELFKASDVNDFMDAFGYHNEFEAGNAYDILQTFKNHKSIQYFAFKNGMSTIINSLVKVLKEKNTTFKISHVIIDTKGNNITYNTKGGNMFNTTYDKVFFCITKNDLLKIPNLSKNIELQKTLNTITTKPLNRVYAQFPLENNNKVWFHDISSRICTNNPIRSIIPINKNTGLIMISYGDSIDAETWNYYKNKKDLERDLMKYIRLMFPNIIISNPIWIENYFWENGTHWPAPYYNNYKNNNNSYYIVGEVMNTNFNGWVEGALTSVEKIF
jgi:protoporphyrinogen oxidase